jgi:hypothetical protein
MLLSNVKYEARVSRAFVVEDLGIVKDMIRVQAIEAAVPEDDRRSLPSLFRRSRSKWVGTLHGVK